MNSVDVGRRRLLSNLAMASFMASGCADSSPNGPGHDASADGEVVATSDASRDQVTGDGSMGFDVTASSDGGAGADRSLPSDAAMDAPESVPAMPDDSSDDAADAPTGDGACGSLSTPPTPTSAARSANYSGTNLAYDNLYGVPCLAVADCVPSCVAAGGTPDSCSGGSVCAAGAGPDGGLGCEPPLYWLDPTWAYSELGTQSFAAHDIVVSGTFVDSLRLTSFHLAIADGAVIRGIEFQVRRAAAFSDGAVDQSVRVLKGDSAVGADHAQTTTWPASLAVTTYGGPADSWGTTWTPADLRADGFGLSIDAKTTQSAGSNPIYVDSVRVVVSYDRPCQ